MLEKIDRLATFLFVISTLPTRCFIDGPTVIEDAGSDENTDSDTDSDSDGDTDTDTDTDGDTDLDSDTDTDNDGTPGRYSVVVSAESGAVTVLESFDINARASLVNEDGSVITGTIDCANPGTCEEFPVMAQCPRAVAQWARNGHLAPPNR